MPARQAGARGVGRLLRGLVALGLLAGALLALAQLRRELCAEVLVLEDLPDLAPTRN